MVDQIADGVPEGESAATPVASPCIRVCRFDSAGQCLGCMRTIGEVRSWFKSSEEDKRALLAVLETRRRSFSDQREGAA